MGMPGHDQISGAGGFTCDDQELRLHVWRWLAGKGKGKGKTKINDIAVSTE